MNANFPKKGFKHYTIPSPAEKKDVVNSQATRIKFTGKLLSTYSKTEFPKGII